MNLSGNTDVLSLFDLVQVLAINQATGMLRVERDDSKGYLYFDTGEVINAIDDSGLEGEDAAKSVFGMQHANFSFVADLPSVARRIQRTTQNLMMEMARQLDEEDVAPGEEDFEDGEHVQEVRQVTDELNELFTRFDHEARASAGTLPSPSDTLAPYLANFHESPDGVLFLAEGTFPEFQVGPETFELGDERWSRATFEKVREQIFDPALKTDPSLGPDETIFAAGVDELFRAIRLSGIDGETILVRRETQGASPERDLPWPPELLHQFLYAPNSILLMTGPPGHTLERSFHAACAWAMRVGPKPFLGMARRWPATLSPSAASVLLATSHSAGSSSLFDTVDRLEPALVAAFDETRVSLRTSVRAWSRGARGIVAVSTRDPAEAPERLIADLRADERSHTLRELGRGLTAVLTVREGLRGGGTAWPVDDSSRVALRQGDFTALASEIAGKGRAHEPRT